VPSRDCRTTSRVVSRTMGSLLQHNDEMVLASWRESLRRIDRHGSREMAGGKSSIAPQVPNLQHTLSASCRKSSSYFSNAPVRHPSLVKEARRKKGGSGSSSLLRFPTGRNSSSKRSWEISPNGTVSFSPFWEIGLVLRGPHTWCRSQSGLLALQSLLLRANNVEEACG
jgi:hypothetical protein